MKISNFANFCAMHSILRYEIHFQVIETGLNAVAIIWSNEGEVAKEKKNSNKITFSK